MKSYDIKTNMDANGSTSLAVDLLTDAIRPVVSLCAKSGLLIGSRMIRFGNIINNILLKQNINSLAEKRSKVSLGMRLVTPDLTQDDGIVFCSPSSLTTNNSGCFLPGDNSDYNTFALIGVTDTLESLESFDNKTVYVNLDNIQNIADSIPDNSAESYSISINYDHNEDEYGSTLEVAVYSGGASISLNDVIYDYIIYNYDSSDGKWDTKESTGDPNIVRDEMNNISIALNNIQKWQNYFVATDSNNRPKAFDKTLISSYPFDCSELTDGLNIYTAFYYIGGKWVFQPDVKYINGNWRYQPNTVS